MKSFEEIMAEKRQRASQENVDVQKSKEVADEEEKRPNNVLWKSRQTKPSKTATGETFTGSIINICFFKENIFLNYVSPFLTLNCRSKVLEN